MSISVKLLNTKGTKDSKVFEAFGFQPVRIQEFRRPFVLFHLSSAVR